VRRGFDKTFNYYGGALNYYTTRSGGGGGGRRALLQGGGGIFDIHAMGEPDRTERYVDSDFYSGIMWQERAEQIITEHAALGTDQPLFMYYAFQNPHGANLQVPEEYMAAAPCAGMTDEARQIYCGMVRLVNENVEKTHGMMRSMISEDFVMICELTAATIHVCWCWPRLISALTQRRSRARSLCGQWWLSYPRRLQHASAWQQGEPV
jgi:hypothetical protein